MSVGTHGPAQGDPDEPVGDRGDQLVEGNLNDDEAQLIMKLTLENVQDHPGWTQDQVESEIICKANARRCRRGSEA